MVTQEYIDKPLVHQGFATQYAKKLRTVALALTDNAIYLFHCQALPSTLTDPTSTTSQIAGLSDRNHVEGWKERFATLLASLKPSHIPQIGPAEIPAELP
jgi:hypothetical protein